MLKLSEAIRLGAMLRPQAFDGYFKDLGGGVIGSCAMGAALEAIGADACPFAPLEFPEEWHISQPAAHPLLRETDPFRREIGSAPVIGPLAIILASLNDQHKWSRERIADYVQWLEEMQPAFQPLWPGAIMAKVSDVPRNTVDVCVDDGNLYRVCDGYPEDAVPAHAERHPHDSELVGAGRGIP
jgi:hypothetical protein